MPKPPIDPVVWRPPPATERARQRSSARTFDLELVDLPAAGEDVAVDGAGRVVVGVSDGRILRIDQAGEISEVANTGGRPLGIEIAPDGTLIVCDFRRGLLHVDPGTGVVEVLVDQIGAFARSLPDLQSKAESWVYDVQRFLVNKYGINLKQQAVYADKAANTLADTATLAAPT